ncbi:Uma2 family endonuclease [Nodosilinea sp. PGN35]|uniref:Uma2 family endonuclease n=1 Tax=Nodosilinea sp. PGN35 TaxID=3020489 RepID=UPI0023B2C3A2|nr:Uma2 family endonuclease [Nodosilinea sp. TSF1-S3]MDF0369431.1 Uma2 family endonuclease [Nodosilinea sp. TSF1-S3]
MTSTPLRTLPTDDQRVVYAGLSWQQFKLIQAGFAQSPGVRLGYYNTTIEILMPGRDHEMFSRLIGFLIGLFCLENAIEFEPTGSMTQEKEGEVSAQADESYCFGASKSIPDLAIEVVFTSGSLGKLQRYQALGVPEVWFWEDGVFSLHRLRGGGYESIDRSEIPELASLDIALLSRCVLLAQTSRLEAASEFRQGLQS